MVSTFLSALFGGLALTVFQVHGRSFMRAWWLRTPESCRTARDKVALHDMKRNFVIWCAAWFRCSAELRRVIKRLRAPSGQAPKKSRTANFAKSWPEKQSRLLRNRARWPDFGTSWPDFGKVVPKVVPICATNHSNVTVVRRLYIYIYMPIHRGRIPNLIIT